MPVSILHVFPKTEDPTQGHALWHGQVFQCALGKKGVINAVDGREGDQKTPAGLYHLKYGYYRADRLSKPESAIPFTELEENDGWCDQVGDPHYNQAIKHPINVSAEELWRQDNLYNIILVTSHNDGPERSDLGSAIFVHVARKGYQPTMGCIAFEQQDLLTILKDAGPNSMIRVHESTPL